MPIRFRCTSCRKLLGIARRKAGTVVKCPDCGTDLIVPTEVTATVPPRRGRRPAARGSTTEPIPRPVPAPPSHHGTNGNGPAAVPKPPESMPLFERPDFEALLNPALRQAVETTPPAPIGAVPVPVKESPPAARPVTDEEAYDLEPVGLVISKVHLTAVAVVVVVLIGVAFAAGYLLAAARLPAG